MSSVFWITRSSTAEGLVGFSAQSPRNSKLSNFEAMATPLFKQEQRVCFIGGSGTIKSTHLDSGTWTYTIEMLLEPECSAQVGSATTIFLEEAELQAD